MSGIQHGLENMSPTNITIIQFLSLAFPPRLECNSLGLPEFRAHTNACRHATAPPECLCVCVCVLAEQSQREKASVEKSHQVATQHFSLHFCHLLREGYNNNNYHIIIKTYYLYIKNQKKTRKTLKISKKSTYY